MDPARLADFETRHFDGALRLSRAVGWPHRREDWALNLSLGRGVVALDGEEVVGAAVATFFGATHATLNLVIVDERRRGTGLGRRLTARALDYCEGRETRLVATRDGLPLYEKLGFAVTGRIAQHQAAAHVAPGPGDAEWARAEDLPMLADIDRRATGMDRAALIERLPQIGRLAVVRRKGAVLGFGAARDFGRGAVVGPVASRCEDTARALIAFLLAARSGDFLRVDATHPETFSPWLAALGLPQTGGGYAMTRPGGASPPRDETFRAYALASQALG